MTDDAFEAFWFLYESSQEQLIDLVKKAHGSGGSKSHITFFNEAIRGALNRSNDTDEFLKAIEQSLELRFYQSRADPLPSQTAMATLFSELKQHGTLAFMPKLVERVQERARERKQAALQQEMKGDKE